MKLPGLVGMMSAVGGLILAIPMAIIGFEFLATDRMVLGVAFLGLAIAVLFLPEYVINRLPRPHEVVSRRLRRIRREKNGD